MDLAVRHQINRVKLVVLVERTDDLGQVLSCERLAAGEHEHAEVSAKGLRNTGDLVRLHLQFLTRPVVQLLCKKAVGTSHVADACHQYVKEYRRDRAADNYAGVAFEYLFCSKIHIYKAFSAHRKQ